MKTIKSLTEAEIAELPTLPDEWKWVKIGEYSFVTKLAGFEYTKYVNYQEKGDIPVIRAQNISKQGFIPRNFVYVDKETMEKLPRSRIHGGEILMVFVGAGLGNVGIVPHNKEYFLGPNVAKIDLGKNLNNKYVSFFLSSVLGFGNISGMSKATAQGSISMSNIREVAIPFVALEEQRAIVSKIEQLFSELDNGISNLKLAQEQLKVYRQAVLKKAFEGELTEEWREKNSDQESADIILNRIIEVVKEKAQKKGKSKNNQKILGVNSQNLPEIPKTWTWASIEQISSFVTDGDHNPPKRTSTGVPHLTARNIVDYKITEENCTYISEEDFEKVRKRYNPQSGDIIITCVGTIGRTAIVPENYIFSADRNLAVIRLVDSKIDSKFVQFYLNNPQAQNDMKNASGSTAQPHLYLKEIRAFPIVLPPIEEQQAIVQEIETRLSVCDKVEQDIETNLEKAEALRQSILKKAFEGKLLNERELAEVRGAEDWESAEVLLERIKAERARK